MLAHQGDCQGTYELSALVNGKPSWTSHSKAIWYCQDQKIWVIGRLNNIGKPNGPIYTRGMLLGANANHKWIYKCEKNWKELETNDFRIECITRKGKVLRI